MRDRSAFVPFLLLSVSFSGLAAAQATVVEHYGPNAPFPSGVLAGYGKSVDAGGDLDLDGVRDVVVGTPDSSRQCVEQSAGSVSRFSGATGQAILPAWCNRTPNQGFGTSVAIFEDVDGDGQADVLVGAPGVSSDGLGGSVVLLSHPFGSVLRAFRNGEEGDRFGTCVARAGDVDGDGTPDIIVGAPGARGSNTVRAGSALIYSGASGTLLRRLDNPLAAGDFGQAVAGAGDFDADGFDDVLVGDPRSSVGYVFSGADGSQLASYAGSSSQDLGFSVCALGDIDLDGFDDVAFGSPSALGAPGRVVVLAGGSGTLMHDLVTRGHAIAGGGDADGDGVPDLIASGPGPVQGRVEVFSGADWSLLLDYRSDETLTDFGYSVDFMDDLNGDGRSDFVVGDPSSSRGGPFAGFVRVVLNDVPEPEVYCFASVNSTGLGARIGHEGPPSISMQKVDLTVVQAPPNRAGIFFYGSNRIQTFLGDGFRCVGGKVARLGMLVTDNQGNAVLPLDFNAPPVGSGPRAVFPGDTWNFQFRYRDPASPHGGSHNTSDALAITFTD